MENLLMGRRMAAPNPSPGEKVDSKRPNVRGVLKTEEEFGRSRTGFCIC
jgi:hypothetical protein